MGPTADQIQGLVNITSLTPKESERWLKAYNCDTAKAVNAFYDDGGILKIQNSASTDWDEEAFHSDRASGGSQHPPSFAVHAQDTLNPQIFNDNAPSRPPSRVSMKGTRGLEARPLLSLAEREEYEMQQAMSQSMTDNQLRGQENGVTAGNNPHFGPATREHYDTQKWTMTLPSTFAQEILENPDPPDRRRGSGDPAFFKPSLAGHRLPALVKILQTIPMGREALLNRAYKLPDYGYEEDWWDGVPIDMKKLGVISGIDRGTEVDDIIYETQRLIAFLEETERAYGSVEALAHISNFKNHPDDHVAGHFLEAWTSATVEAYADNPFATVFQTASMTTDSDEREVETHLHHSFDISVPDADADSARDLYEIMDGQFWGDYLENDAGYHCLKKAGEILCIQLSCQKEEARGTGVKIPAILYLDRYFASSKDRVQDLLKTKRIIKEDIKAIDDSSDRILRYKSPTGDTTFDAPNLIGRVLEHFVSVAGKGVTLDTSENGQVIEELKALAESVSIKVATLQNARNSAVEKLKEISRWSTTAAEDVREPPHYRYTLRGVSSSNETLYVLERHFPNIIEPSEWQWWKLTYSKGTTQPVSKTRAQEVEVLKAAKDDSRLALLVYASENALAVEHTELPTQLKNFVRADNLNFSAELEKHESPKATTLTKRKVGDRYGNADGSFHSSEDGLEAVEIPLEDPSERSPLIKKPSSPIPRQSGEEASEPDFGPLRAYATSLKEMQETNDTAAKRTLDGYNSDLEMEE